MIGAIVSKIRTDQLLVKQGLVEDCTRARALIMAGKVRVGADRVVRSAAEKWPEDTAFIVETPRQYVSRGAFKLLPALDQFLPDLTGLTALDVGASTGGFTDLMLQRGAVRVYAVDVGYGQLHLRLREDPRVICLERVNARHLSREQIPEWVDVVTIDVSFISLRLILPALPALLAPGARIFALVKPQFEAERREVERGGVVRSAEVRARIFQQMEDFVRTRLSWDCPALIPSPITGPKGNQEAILVCTAPPTSA